MNKQKPRILCVDDENLNLQLYKGILENAGYTVIPATSGQQALDTLAHELADIVILDLMMPEMDGFTVLKTLRSNPATENLPVIVATALSDRATKLQALETGANDFLYKPLDRPEMLLRVRNLLKAKEYQDLLQTFNQRLQHEVRHKTQELRLSYIETVHRLVMASEFKDEDTGDHISRISSYARCLGEAVGLAPLQCDLLYYASPMHDIGKIGIPDQILCKQGPLDDQEMAIMRQHTEIGARILKDSSAPILQMAESIALSHHERWDGTGYPHGLAGDAIPLPARIVTLVDVYDALRMRRPYKQPFDHQTAVSIILEGDGRTRPEHFDPELLALFRRLHPCFDTIFNGEIPETCCSCTVSEPEAL